MGVTFNRISENISEGQGTDWRYFECLGSFVVSTNGNICGNLKMVFLFLPQLAELVPVGCLGEWPRVRISEESKGIWQSRDIPDQEPVWAQNGFWEWHLIFRCNKELWLQPGLNDLMFRRESRTAQGELRSLAILFPVAICWFWAWAEDWALPRQRVSDGGKVKPTKLLVGMWW